VYNTDKKSSAKFHEQIRFHSHRNVIKRTPLFQAIQKVCTKKVYLTLTDWSLLFYCTMFWCLKNRKLVATNFLHRHLIWKVIIKLLFQYYIAENFNSAMQRHIPMKVRCLTSPTPPLHSNKSKSQLYLYPPF
jgi:hypothetical protein